jgi:serine/threonine protein kinase
VCDFGLSQVKESKEDDLMDPKGRLRGSPLWMAPEVLSQQPFTQQADVYAFALVLWEACTRKKPYSHIKTLKQLQSEVCSFKKRPAIPDDIPKSLQKIIEDCWAPDPSDRPTMDVVVDRLERSLTDVAIDDENARTFWNANFAGKSRVRFDKFQTALNEFLHIDAESVDEMDASIRSKCLRAMLGLEIEGSNKSDMVHIEALGKVLHWLGPLSTSADFYDHLSGLLSKAWFHGAVQTAEAEHRLADRAEGCFLIRFSTSQPGSYTISKVKKGGNPVHQRIERKNNAYHVASRSYASLELLLQGEYENLGLRGACPGSRYNAIFADAATAGSYYVETGE